MTLFTSAVPIWLNVTCDECSTHQDVQIGPENMLREVFRCTNCGSNEFKKVNISGKSNGNMQTAEEVQDK